MTKYSETVIYYNQIKNEDVDKARSKRRHRLVLHDVIERILKERKVWRINS